MYVGDNGRLMQVIENNKCHWVVDILCSMFKRSAFMHWYTEGWMKWNLQKGDNGCIDKVITKQIHDQLMESQHFLDYYSGIRFIGSPVKQVSCFIGHFTWNGITLVRRCTKLHR